MIVALLLTFAAGKGDIVGYLAIYKIFTAHRTGDTVHLAEHLFTARIERTGIAAAVTGPFSCARLPGAV